MIHTVELCCVLFKMPTLHVDISLIAIESCRVCGAKLRIILLVVLSKEGSFVLLIDASLRLDLNIISISSIESSCIALIGF